MYDAIPATEAKASPFGNDFPEHAPAAQARNGGPIAEALGYTGDRLARLEHVLGDLNGVIERLTYDLRPVLPNNGGIPEPDGVNPRTEDPEVDRRSTVARRVVALGHRADYLADVTGYLRNKVAGLVEHLELEGVDA